MLNLLAGIVSVLLSAAATVTFLSTEIISPVPNVTTLPQLSQKIGEAEDRAGERTLFAKLNEILSKIGTASTTTGTTIDLSNLATLQNQLLILGNQATILGKLTVGTDVLSAKIGTNVDSPGTPTLFAYLGKLNLNLDAAITSRAPASTAVSNLDYTSSRALKLDNMDALISSRLASSSYVAPDNAMIGTINTKLGTNTDPLGTTTIFAWFAKVNDYLTNTINATLNTINTKIGTNTDPSGTTTLFARLASIVSGLGATGDAASPTGSANAKLAEVLNRIPQNSVSVQYGSITITAPSTSGTFTISPVNTGSSVVMGLGESTNAPTTAMCEGLIYVTLTNSTTVTATKGGGGTYNATINFVVISFNALSVKSIQDVYMTGADGSTVDTATISAVNTSKSLIIMRSPIAAPSPNCNNTGPTDIFTRVTLTNSTTLTKTRATAPPGPGFGRFDLAVTVLEFN